jgi:elongation factor Ts
VLKLQISTQMVKDLRERTAAGVLDCRDALVACDGDLEKAAAYLLEKGLAAVKKREDRKATEGVLEAYVHPGSRVAVLLELNCETDFVAGTDEFKELAHDLTLHIAFAAPKYFVREEVPESVIEQERSIYRAEALREGKPERIVDRIADGRVEKFLRDLCLLEQPFVKDEDITVQDRINAVTVKLGEKVVLRRFVRYQLGEELE